MYAVIKTGGKQYKVEAGSILTSEKIEGEVGDKVIIEDVLLYTNGDEIKIGQPQVEGATVEAKIIAQTKGEKVVIFKKRRRHGSQVKKGHRQPVTKLEVTAISV